MVDISVLPFWIWWFLGFVAGYGLALFICSKRKDGVIHIRSGIEDQKEVYLFEFNVPPENIPEMKQVVFCTQYENDDSQNLHTF